MPPHARVGLGDESVETRLKKLVAAKDAQCAALAARIEVLTDDICKVQAECKCYTVKNGQLQELADSHGARAKQWENEARIAMKRASKAEAELTAAEARFAGDLEQLRMALSQVTNAELKAVQAELDDARAQLHAVSANALEKCSAIGCLADQHACNRGSFASRGEQIEAPTAAIADRLVPSIQLSQAGLLDENASLRELVEALNEKNASLLRDIDVLSDALMARTEAELRELPHPARAKHDEAAVAVAAPSPDSAASVRTRWRNEMRARVGLSPLPAADLPDPLRAQPSTPSSSISVQLAAQPSTPSIAVRLAAERRSPSVSVQSVAQSPTPSMVRGAMTHRPGWTPLDSNRGNAGYSLAHRTGASCAAGRQSSGPSSTQPPKCNANARGSAATKSTGHLVATEADFAQQDRLVHEHIRALLVAKEAALSAVATL